MKKILICLFAVIVGSNVYAQDITGSWIGSIPVNGTQLHLIFHIKKASDTSYSSTFDSPDQKAFGIPCSATYIKKDSLLIGIAAIGGGYNGVWNGKDSIAGTYHQGGGKIAMNLKRTSDAEKVVAAKDPVRPQTPKPPYGYYTQDVEYDNADKSLHYGATFTRPEGSGKYPTAIIISGSGTQDRDGSMLGHKPYWVLADYLAKNGVAVLRVDDRGAGKSSIGDDINGKTTLDFSYDIEASLNYLETRADVDKKHIGLIGHSEGGIIAPMVAARRKDVSFIVMWGAPEIGGAQTMAEQFAHYKLKPAGIDSVAIQSFTKLQDDVFALFKSAESKDALDQAIKPVYDNWKKEQSQKILDALYVNGNSIVGADIFNIFNSYYDMPWMRFFIAYDPAHDLSKVTCKVLAINGSKDTQVNAVENLAKIKEVLTKSGNKQFEVKSLDGLNHLLQTAVTGDLTEYEKIDETISPVALNIICTWIKLHTR